jgi:2',3'-cyclic-nucleotide 2'-phosphodiesterase (5'-nucleotidase family)
VLTKVSNLSAKTFDFCAMNSLFKTIVLLFVLVSCKQNEYTLTKIEGQQIEINDSISGDVVFDSVLKPFRERVENQLSEVLAYNVRDMNRADGPLNSSIGNMMADAVMELGNPVFNSQTGKDIDFVLLNFGGIRATMGQGAVNRRTAFEIMPFENEIVVLELSPDKIKEMLEYLKTEMLAHPVSGIEIQLNKNSEISKVKIQGKPLDSNKSYFVATSDYLKNGGDRMYFFENALSETMLNYKLRNLFIDYFIKKDTIDFMPDNRFIKSN